jgi:GNAT superfamily N-acetyltransferase
MFRARHGQLVAVQQATAMDTVMLAELLCRLSERTRHLRYMRTGAFTAEVIWNEAVRMARGHTPDHTTLVATVQPNEYDEAIAVAELIRDRDDRNTGEIALVVRDDAQRQGIGSFLLRRLLRVAQRSSITCLSAGMLAENKAMLQLIGALGLPYTSTTCNGETQVRISLPRHTVEIGLAHRTRKLAA